ncbi:hypothetical protein IJ670_03205 [bacterium]|nr:hypothetical protein [bacterium]
MKNENIFLASLIKDVLENKKTVQQALGALIKHPQNTNTECVFNALMYREADEDLRKDEEYKTVQDEYLKNLVDILEKDELISMDILNEYRKYQKFYIPNNSKDFKSIVKYLKRKISF